MPLGDGAHRPIDAAAVPAAAAEAAQELVNHVQAEPVPSASDIFDAGATPQPTFVWGQAEPPADQTEPPASQTSSSSFFSTTAGIAPFGSAQAGGSSPKQPNSHSRKAAGRRPATARGRSAAKQAGNVQTGTEPSAWDSGAANMPGSQFGAASSQSGVGPDIKMPSSGMGAAEDSQRTAFTFAGSSSSLQVPAEGPDQHPAAYLSTTPESTPRADSPHSPIGNAAVPAAAAECTQELAKHGSAHEQANHVQAEPLPAEPLPSDPVSPQAMPAFVWGEAKPAATQNSSSSFFESPAFGAEAAGSSLRQPSCHSRKGRRQATTRGKSAAKQAGRVSTANEPVAWESGAFGMHSSPFGTASSQSGMGPGSQTPTFGIDAAEHKSRPTFIFADSNQPTPRQEQSAAATGSAAECKFTFAAGSASHEGSDAEASAFGSSADTAASNSKS
ncbi:hypothetical protein ABBQ38_013343 [Trebouxia sp. C0009 RCD-2024]